MLLGSVRWWVWCRLLGVDRYRWHPWRVTEATAAMVMLWPPAARGVLVVGASPGVERLAALTTARMRQRARRLLEWEAKQQEEWEAKLVAQGWTLHKG